MNNKVYTKKGDSGTTSLLSGKRVSKLYPEIKAVGALDELNSWIGLTRTYINPMDVSSERFDLIQWNLFNAGASVINDTDNDIPSIGDADTKMLEDWMDEMNKELPELKNFILPKGSKGISTIHISRTVCRRAEIEVLSCQNLDNLNRLKPITVYLNRLSDWLFVLARWISKAEGNNEMIWKN